MDSNSIASLPSVGGPLEICTLCGLMCALRPSQSNHCNRLGRWLAAAPLPQREMLSSDVSQRLSKVKLDAGTLIWLDACDVQTTRAAVLLARQVGATIHVGQSTGAQAVKSVIASDGWLGTTLSELSARAELIVTLCDGAISQSPLLAERFFQSQTRAIQPVWIHISQHAGDDKLECQVSENGMCVKPHELIHWPRAQWFERLSQLAIGLQPPESQVSPTTVPTIANLSAKLLAAKQSVWLWDVDELHFQFDELIVRRMLGIASFLSERARCTLLPLDLNIGRVTAEETLLWLTGCPTTATWSGRHWYRSPRYTDNSLAQLSAAFSSIVLVRSLESDRRLPSFPTDLTIDTGPAKQQHELQVAAVGRDCSGHLFRGDRGAVLYVESTLSSELPTAAELLTQMTENAVAH